MELRCGSWWRPMRGATRLDCVGTCPPALYSFSREAGYKPCHLVRAAFLSWFESCWVETGADPAECYRLDASAGRPEEGNMYTKSTYGTAPGEGAVFVVTGSASRVRPSPPPLDAQRFSVLTDIHTP